MKRLFLAVGLFAATALAPLAAQTTDLQANIPFDFLVGEKLMPAGPYLVHHSIDGVLSVRQQEGVHAAAMLLTLPASRKSAAKQGGLEFNRYGDMYFLSRIWLPESKEGRAVFKSAREKEVAINSSSIYSASIPLRK